MSYCTTSGPDGKDRVIFLTEEDSTKPSTVELSDTKPADAPQGLITESGEINWDCPCLGGMAVGPCGVEFREAFSCFHYSKEEPKGADCLEAFQAMQDCMKDYPELYEKENDGGGESKENTDSDDKLQTQNIPSEDNKESVPNSSNAFDAPIATQQTRTNENLSDSLSASSLSLNDSEKVTGEQALASTQMSSSSEKEKENSTQITDVNTIEQVTIVDSISSIKEE